MKVTSDTSLSSVNLASLQAGAKSLGNDDKVRAKTTGVFTKSVELYSSDKARGHFSKDSTRLKKQEGALDFVKTALTNTLKQLPGGDPEGRLQAAFGSIVARHTPASGSDLTGREFKAILREAQAVMDQHMVDTLKDQSSAYAKASLDSLAKLPDVPPGTVASGEGNVIRTNAMKPEHMASAFAKVQSGKMDDLTPHEGVNGLRKLWEQLPPVPPDKLGALLRSPHIPGAVGKYTAANTLKNSTLIPDNSAGAKATAAAGLKELIDSSLTPPEKAALKERVEYLAQLGTLAQTKYGAPSERLKDDSAESTKVWIKSLGVSAQAYLGVSYDDMGRQIGSNAQGAAARSQDLMTALILHKDAIFGE